MVVLLIADVYPSYVMYRVSEQIMSMTVLREFRGNYSNSHVHSVLSLAGSLENEWNEIFASAISVFAAQTKTKWVEFSMSISCSASFYYQTFWFKKKIFLVVLLNYQIFDVPVFFYIQRSNNYFILHIPFLSVVPWSITSFSPKFQAKKAKISACFLYFTYNTIMYTYRKVCVFFSYKITITDEWLRSRNVTDCTTVNRSGVAYLVQTIMVHP